MKMWVIEELRQTMYIELHDLQESLKRPKTITKLRKDAKCLKCNSGFMSKIEGEDLMLSTFNPNLAIERNSHLH